METKQFLEDAFDKVMNSYEDLKKVVGFEEKVQNYVDELNRCLSTTDCKIKDLPYKYNLYDAFVNKTEPIIDKISFK